MSGSGVWRFNVDTTWHYFSSAKASAAASGTANNDFIRYHHVRSCLYFSVGTLESFLNREMRTHLEAQGTDEETIIDKLSRPSIMTKLRTWPEIVYGKAVDLAPLLKTLDEHRVLRHEVTHPKRRDHSIYVELDGCNPTDLTDAVAVAVVTMLEAKGKPFPFWLLGWNFVGMNNNPAYPVQLGNMNGFAHSLRAMGFAVGGHNPSFERDFMTGATAFHSLKMRLDAYPHDIEPYRRSPFGPVPRLTRRWWDHEFILADVQAAEAEAQDREGKY